MNNFRSFLSFLALIACLIVLIILGIEAYEVYKDINKQEKAKSELEKAIEAQENGECVVVTWEVDSVRFIDSGDPNVMIGIADVKSKPKFNKLKDGELINQNKGWSLMEQAQAKYFKK